MEGSALDLEWQSPCEFGQAGNRREQIVSHDGDGRIGSWGYPGANSKERDPDATLILLKESRM